MKNYLKYIGGLVGIVLVGVGVLWGVREYRYRKSPEYQTVRYFNDLADQYAKDTYGGETPEETLQLFIDVLKKGDVELASKYFVVGKQEEWKENFIKIRDDGKFDLMLADIMKAKKYKEDEEMAVFTAGNERNESVINMIMYKNSQTGKWKISEL